MKCNQNLFIKYVNNNTLKFIYKLKSHSENFLALVPNKVRKNLTLICNLPNGHDTTIKYHLIFVSFGKNVSPIRESWVKHQVNGNQTQCTRKTFRRELI